MTLYLGDLDASLHGRVINRLEDHLIHVKGLIALKGKSEFLKGVSESLHADTDRSVAHI